MPDITTNPDVTSKLMLAFLQAGMRSAAVGFGVMSVGLSAVAGSVPLGGPQGDYLFLFGILASLAGLVGLLLVMFGGIFGWKAQ